MAMAALDFSQTKTEILSNLLGNTFYDNIKQHLAEIDANEKDINETDQCNRWLSWAHSDRSLKVISADVPQGILPNNYEGRVHDVKVFVKYGPDDAVYDNNKEIRERVARGNCFLELINKTKRTQCVLQAMKKFTGGLGDDDDRESGDDLVWQKYFTKSLEETDFVVATEKANGEAAHLSCVQIDGQAVLCGGSKNVHLLFRNKDDINKYVEPRYRIATEVCHTVMQFLDNMAEENKERLLAFLVATRYTAVFEILSPLHQHVVNLSHLERPKLKFISWTKCELDPSDKLEHLNIIPPHTGIEIARCLGLDAVVYDVVAMNELDQRMKQIRQGFNTEGEVLFFIDKLGAVIGLLKKKTVWYVMCRAIREKVKAACLRSKEKPSNFSMSKSLSKFEMRTKEIQKWLNLNDSTTASWRTLGTSCMKWVLEEVDDARLSLDEVRDMFPAYWARFLKDTGATDRFDVNVTTMASKE